MNLLATLTALSLALALALAEKQELLRKVFRDANAYYDSLEGSMCGEPLVASATLSSANSESGQINSDIECEVWGRAAWIPESSNFNQNLIVDFGAVKNVTGITTQGRPKSNNDYVMEFVVQFSHNGQDWMDVKDVDGSQRLFQGNEDAKAVVHTTLSQAIVARWLKITPTRWANRIALRMEVVGCDYHSQLVHFDGHLVVQKDLSKNPLVSIQDGIQFRFKTNNGNGVILYGSGSQGDFMSLQLIESKLFFSVNLGFKETSLTLGSLLDDNLFHDVVISRQKRDLIMSVDGAMVMTSIKDDLHLLHLDRHLFIGGVPNLFEGIHVFDNFTGCIDNFAWNKTKILDETSKWTSNLNKLPRNCPSTDPKLPVTFRNSGSFLRLSLPNNVNAKRINISLEFRTFEKSGLLMYHSLNTEGHVKMYLEDGRLKVAMAANDIPKVLLDNLDVFLNDGKWHTVSLDITVDKAMIIIDNEPIEASRILDLEPGPFFMIGGGLVGHRGFIGCMRHLIVGHVVQDPSTWTEDEVSAVDDVSIGACYVFDKCSPNPCQHGGICKQNSEEYYCECEETGYTGAVCHTSVNFKSCVHYKNVHPDAQYAETVLDIDGSGPLAPFPARCEFFPDGRQMTYIGHANEEATKVDGFDEKGSFKQLIHYDTNLETMEAVINRSKTCAQKLGYDCKRSRLLNTPIKEDESFSPFGYWVSRQNRPMDYWAGSLPGSQKCECGLLGVCFDPMKWCNCDSGHDDWLWDGGEIKEKEYLPVRALHFGDTGNPLDTKEGRFSLGPLECDGDSLFDNAITFRKEDAVLKLPSTDFGPNGDIFFEFKTTSFKTMILFHSVGTNGDFIKITLISGDQVQFTYASGKGQQGVVVEPSYRLDDNKWHSVLVERNSKEAMMVIDGVHKSQIKEPTGPARPMLLDDVMSIGAADDFSYGFVGCIRALVMNGQAVDLVGEVSKSPKVYGLSIGCRGKCDRKPCMNGGTCTEGYSGFKCDCSNTPFTGPICSNEVGVSLSSGDMVKYEFRGEVKATTEETIHIGFTTNSYKGILLAIVAKSGKEFVMLTLSKKGHLVLNFDYGFGEQELSLQEQNFMTGRYHNVWIRRTKAGRRVELKVDQYQAEVYEVPDDISSALLVFSKVEHMYIGRNETMSEGFEGCISRLEYSGLYPLKLLFGSDRPSNLFAIPDSPKADFCGVEPVTLAPETEETRLPEQVEQENIGSYYHSTIQSTILGVVLAILFIILVLATLMVGKYLNRHKGEYLTREDEGAQDACDADTAVLQGKTGHQVEKKKEWFL